MGPKGQGVDSRAFIAESILGKSCRLSSGGESWAVTKQWRSCAGVRSADSMPDRTCDIIGGSSEQQLFFSKGFLSLASFF